jgi:hypothetical protein
MWAIWTRARSELRASWRTWLLLAILIGAASGAATAAVADARRPATAYLRIVAWANPSDVETEFPALRAIGMSGQQPAVAMRSE